MNPLKKLFPSLFKPTWQPKYKVGDRVICSANELSPYINSSIFTGIIIERTKYTINEFYEIKCSTLLDHEQQPLIISVHESHIKQVNLPPSNITIHES